MMIVYYGGRRWETVLTDRQQGKLGPTVKLITKKLTC